MADCSSNNLIKCDICGRTYLSKQALYAHKKRKHTTISHDYNFVNCPICGIRLAKSHFRRHLKREHNLNENDKMFLVYVNSYTNHYMSKIPNDVSEKYMLSVYNENKLIESYARQFESFYLNITKIRAFFDSDIENFIKNVLPWKNAHPKLGNCKELCRVMFPNEPDLAERFYNEQMKSKNPFVGHGSELSPFSTNFIGYRDLSDEDKTIKANKAKNYDKIGRNWNQVEYWTKQGYSVYEAKRIISKKQSTFSLKICIEKYGEEIGRKIFAERQNKWQKTLKEKPESEQKRILKAKVENSRIKKDYSTMEHEFSKKLVDESCMNVPLTTSIIPDIVYGDKVIEFYGDYYHCNPKMYEPDYYNFSVGMTAKEKWKKDGDRIFEISKLGYKVKIVWEDEYLSNQEKVIEECKLFLRFG